MEQNHANPNYKIEQFAESKNNFMNEKKNK